MGHTDQEQSTLRLLEKSGTALLPPADCHHGAWGGGAGARGLLGAWACLT